MALSTCLQNCAAFIENNKKQVELKFYLLDFLPEFFDASHISCYEILDRLWKLNYFNESDTSCLLNIFTVAGMKDCSLEINRYSQAHNSSRSIENVQSKDIVINSASKDQDSSSNYITDSDIIHFSEKINVTDIRNLAVVGFGLNLIQFDNCTNNKTTSDKIIEIFRQWRNNAPSQDQNNEIPSAVPAYTKKGLCTAFSRSNLRGYCNQLGLESYFNLI